MIKPVLSKLVRLVRNENGVAAIEFAIMFPAMALMYFGMLDLTYFISVNRQVTGASSVVADLITAKKGKIYGDQVSDYFYAGYQMMRPIPMDKIKIDAYNYAGADPSPANPAERWSQFSGVAAGCGAPPASSTFANLMTKNNDLVLVRVCYSYKPLFGSFVGEKLLGNANINIVQNTYERPRLSDMLTLVAGAPPP